MTALNTFLNAVYDHANQLLDAVRADRIEPLEVEWESSAHPESGREWRTAIVPSRVTNVLSDATWDRAYEAALRDNPKLADRIDKLADAHRALIHAAGKARDQKDYLPDGAVYEAHCIAIRRLAALAPPAPATDHPETLRDAIQELLFSASHPPQNAAEEQGRQAALRVIREVVPPELSADSLRDMKAAAIRICSAQGRELDTCISALRRAQDELWAAQGRSVDVPATPQTTATKPSSVDESEVTERGWLPEGSPDPAPEAWHPIPLTGKKQQLARWLSLKEPALDTKIKNSVYVGRLEGRYKRSIWFRDPQAYAKANLKRIEEESAAAAKAPQTKKRAASRRR